MADYIPTSDAEYNNWQASFVEIVDANATVWGIPPERVTQLKAKQAIWTPAYGKASNKQNRTSADVREKDDTRAEYEEEIRGFVAQWLAFNNKVSDSERERMGLNIRSNTHKPVPVPTSLPVGTVDFSIRLQHTIYIVDDESPRSKAKPKGVHGCEIWIKIGGEPPKDASEMTYLATCTRSPYKTTFNGADAGKKVYYLFRWVNTRNNPGPWSNFASAMIVD